MLEELIAYYEKHTIFVNGEFVKCNLDYGIEYSKKAVLILKQHQDIHALHDTLKDYRVRQDMPDMDYHTLLQYIIYPHERVEHVRACRQCGYYYSYENLLRPVNLKTGRMSIPVKCPECSGRY